MQHELKCWPEHFMAIERGAKTCELRLNDRNYQVNDTLLLREWEPLESAYTGTSLHVLVTHILSGGVWLSPGYIAMSIAMIEEPIDRAAVERVHALFMQKLAVAYPDHPWLKKGSIMTTQAQPPTDAEQVQTLRTANALLRQRLGEQEQIAIRLRSELVGLETQIAALQIERDMLEHRLDEAHQTMNVMEETV